MTRTSARIPFSKNKQENVVKARVTENTTIQAPPRRGANRRARAARAPIRPDGEQCQTQGHPRKPPKELQWGV